MEHMNIFGEKFHKIISESVQSVLLEGNSVKEETPSRSDEWSNEKENNLSCSYCRIKFEDARLQREHYKLDWHRYNLKQSLLAKLPITEDEFNEKTGNDDLSSISGSDTEKEDSLDTYVTAQGKIFLSNNAGQVFAIYRCLLFDKKEEVSDIEILNNLKNCCIVNQQWTILMLGGGHFAGAVFQGNEPALHKTFHCYTVRAGQGGTQSSKDNKSGGSQPKSAGASLRRYNEQALVQHVKGIIDAWRTEIEKSSLIIYRASGPYNRNVLFGGSNPLLERSDRRLRTIPFSTRRATFTEVKRVHSLLTSAEVYSSVDDASLRFSKQKSPDAESKRNKVRSSAINRAKSRETVERPLPGKLSSASSSETELSKENGTNIKLDQIDFVLDELEIDFSGLQEFDDSLTPEQRKKARRKKKPKKSKSKKLKEQEEARKKELVEIVYKGNLLKLKNLLENYLKSAEQDEDEEKVDKDAFFNEVLDENLNTMLHIAALNEHDEVLLFLLENGANPCLKNKSQHTAYTCTQSKEIRETLKQFARDNPEKYNYNKAQIPTNALTNEELAERRKEKRKVKRKKETEKRKENEIKKKEDEEKTRFLKLSDREKRALAAERRILDQSGTVIARCFLCGSDMKGEVPFEYLDNRFCTIQCLRAHRMQNPVVLS